VGFASLAADHVSNERSTWLRLAHEKRRVPMQQADEPGLSDSSHLQQFLRWFMRVAVVVGLLQVVAAARLLGAEAALVGIRTGVAQALVGLGVDMRAIRTFGDLQSALAGLDGVPTHYK
jgi:hypothetical protein